ncbi:MAG: helix-turn-helix transcriptional regulator [Saprospiraceae bacterium]|nr:helix-turn-helix transcriptional regulator [Saprospiraceae bacterium]
MGDYLRKERLDRGLLQIDLAKRFKVSLTTIITWELNLKQPTPMYAKPIITFLGYFPLWKENLSIGTQLYYARLITGKTQVQVSKILGCNPTNLIKIEKNSSRKIFPVLTKRIKQFINHSIKRIPLHKKVLA